MSFADELRNEKVLHDKQAEARRERIIENIWKRKECREIVNQAYEWCKKECLKASKSGKNSVICSTDKCFMELRKNMDYGDNLYRALDSILGFGSVYSAFTYEENAEYFLGMLLPMLEKDGLNVKPNIEKEKYIGILDKMVSGKKRPYHIVLNISWE